MRPILSAWSCLRSSLLTVGPLLLWLSSAGAEGVRHEYVPASFFARHAVDEIAARIEAGAPIPRAIHRDGERLGAPGQTGAKAPVFQAIDGARTPGAQPDQIQRPSLTRPDRQTEADAPLTYHALFNPTVAPMRRNVAFNAVAADHSLRLVPGALTPVEVRTDLLTATLDSAREMFWGDVKVTLRGGEPAAIPSVAPDMRVLAVRTEPRVPVHFLVDTADNYYVQASRGAHEGSLRVVFLVDAPRTYFGAPTASNAPLGGQAGADDTALPPETRRTASRVLAHLNVSADDPFDVGLDRLVRWFRAFKAGPPPAGADLYEALALGQVGVCRHRAFGFTITARAAGVPTRYVENEAHAFVEVRAPDGAWRRIDLGGEAPSLKIEGPDDRRLHVPPPDPYGAPEGYDAQYSRQVETPAPGGAEVQGRPPKLGGGGEAQARSGGGGGGVSQQVTREVEVALPAMKAPEVRVDADAGLTLRAVRVKLEMDGDHEAFRGEAAPFMVEGVVVAEAEGGHVVRGVKVQIYLVSLTGQQRQPVPVGRDSTTDQAGRFRVRLELPDTTPLGRYRLVAASAGGKVWAAGRSDQP